MPDMASALQARHGKIKNEFPWENNGLHPMAPNDETAASVSLSADILGNIPGRRRCALSPALRWRRFWQIFPDRSAWERLRQGRTLAFWQL
jgi:hypothetical protein